MEEKSKKGGKTKKGGRGWKRKRKTRQNMEVGEKRKMVEKEEGETGGPREEKKREVEYVRYRMPGRSEHFFIECRGVRFQESCKITRDKTGGNNFEILKFCNGIAKRTKAWIELRKEVV